MVNTEDSNKGMPFPQSVIPDRRKPGPLRSRVECDGTEGCHRRDCQVFCGSSRQWSAEIHDVNVDIRLLDRCVISS